MKKAIFWDLQGTLGGEATADIGGFEFYPFAYQALQLAMEKGYMNIIITNQSRIGKGSLSLADYEAKVQKLQEEFKIHHIKIDEFLCCPHTSEEKCECKKPKIGLINYCVEKYGIDIKQSYVIGDMGKNEIIMAKNAGAKGILVLTGAGLGSVNEFRYTWANYEADRIEENALRAVENL